MFNIQKISQRYDSREDRIEVAIQNEAGNVVRLWLTQRLANRMLAVLMKWLPDLQEEAKQANGDKHHYEANKEEPKEVAVNFNTAKEEGLLTTIDMRHQQKDYILTFKWGVTGVANIHMGLQQLNSFIEGLAQLFRAAQWDMKAFPTNKINTLSRKTPDFEDFSEDSVVVSRTIH